MMIVVKNWSKIRLILDLERVFYAFISRLKLNDWTSELILLLVLYDIYLFETATLGEKCPSSLALYENTGLLFHIKRLDPWMVN